MTFSLILATVGGTDDLYRLFRSLCRQTHQDFEVIVIDQNEDDRVAKILNEFEGRFAVTRLRSARGLSRARNVGLPYAKGDIVAFPDDDCWYEQDLLQRVFRELEEHPQWSGVTGSSTAGKWNPHPAQVTARNAWQRSISFTIFLRRSAVGDLRFDETLGVGSGTPWGSGEETDFLLRMLDRGAVVQYVPSICVNHPDLSFRSIGRVKSRSYARGMGRLLRKHRFPFYQVGFHILRPLAASLLALVRGNVAKAAYHYECCVGRVEGWTGLKLSPVGARL